MRLFTLPAAFAAIAFAYPALAAPTYTLTDIGNLPGGGDYSIAYGINNLGQVVGASQTAAGTRAFVWTNGVMTELANLPGGESFGAQARGINDAGQIVGYGTGRNANNQNVTRGIVWQNGVPTSMGDLPGGSDLSQGFAINNNGQVAGTSYATAQPTAVGWQNGTLTNLADLPGATNSQGFAINNSGQIAGVSLRNGQTKATRFANGQATDLGDLPGGVVVSTARGINDAGHIVGSSSTGTSEGTAQHAFLWVNGVMTDLGDLAGGSDHSIAHDINNDGVVVGVGYDEVDGQATMWSGGQIFSLASLVSNLGGWRLNIAHAINDSGQIVGYGTLDGYTRAFLLTPGTLAVPEPAALTLFGLGVAGLALRRRRRAAGLDRVA